MSNSFSDYQQEVCQVKIRQLRSWGSRGMMWIGQFGVGNGYVEICLANVGQTLV